MMRGQEALIAMRQRGKAPTMVFLDTTPCGLKAWRDWAEVSPATPSLWVEPADAPHRLDLRCLVGLRVLVSGEDSQRVRAVVEAAKAAHASHVFGNVVRPIGRGEFRRFEVVESIGFDGGEGSESPEIGPPSDERGPGGTPVAEGF